MYNFEQLFLFWYAAFILSLVFHEASHAFIGARLGDKVAAKSGQITLNPFPHMKREMLGTVFVPILAYITSGFMIGWASAPFNLNWAKSHPRKFALMSLAGPLSNLFIVIITILIINIGSRFGIFFAPASVNLSHVTDSHLGGIFNPICTILSVLFSLNIILFVFNSLPLPILDGSKIPLFFLKKELSDKYIRFIMNPKMMIITLVIIWFIFQDIHRPIRLFFLGLLYPGISYG
jgi:Zn-dependent protease